MRTSWFRLVPGLVFASMVTLTVVADEPLPAPVQPGKASKAAGKRVKTSTAQEQQLSDAEALKKAKLSETDGGKLVEYLQQRTLTETEQGRIATIIKRFGADDFEERVRATEEIETFGSAAIGPLKAAAKDSDPEVAFRARIALSRVETIPHSAVSAAAVRAVVRLKPEGAAAALLGFLPLADDDSVADLIRRALISLAVGKDGKADPALVAALHDSSPIRRAAVYVALIEGGPATERIRIKDAYQQVRAAILKESDLDTKFAGLWSLVLTTREKEYLTELVTMIPHLPRGRIWQLEDLLLQLAGSHPKDGRFLKSPESLAKSRDAWLSWWKEKVDSIDLGKFEYKQRVAGYTDILEMDVRFNGPGRFISLGHDMKEKWRIGNLNYPTDARVAADGHVFIVESNNHRVTERNTSGTGILKTRTIYQQPVNISLLPEGGLLVVCRNNMSEFDKNGNQKWTFPRNNYDIWTGARLANGDSLVITNNGQPKATGTRLNSKGEVTGKPYTFGLIQDHQRMDVLGDEKILLCEHTRVAEYDLKSGKLTWQYPCDRPSSCQRLVNGNTLIAQLNYGSGGRVIEIDPSGEIVWQYESRDGLRAGRAYRR